MNVVWHQAIGVEIEGKFGFLLLEQDSEPEVIIVGPEDLSTIIPASDQVIEPSSNFDPWFPWHGADASVRMGEMSTNSSLTRPVLATRAVQGEAQTRRRILSRPTFY